MIRFSKNGYEFNIDDEFNIKCFQKDDISEEFKTIIQFIIDRMIKQNAPENGFLISNIATELKNNGFEIIALFDEDMELSDNDTVY